MVFTNQDYKILYNISIKKSVNGNLLHVYCIWKGIDPGVFQKFSLGSGSTF